MDRYYHHGDSHVHVRRPTALRLDDTEARARLSAHDHGVLCTTHADRGIDAVPVVYAVDHHGHLGIPIDRVKAKSSLRLQRERNLAADPRATLLVERWDRDDWSALWWVRAKLRWLADPPDHQATTLATLLAERYPQYAGQPFERILVFDVAALTGWAA